MLGTRSKEMHYPWYRGRGDGTRSWRVTAPCKSACNAIQAGGLLATGLIRQRRGHRLFHTNRASGSFIPTTWGNNTEKCGGGHTPLVLSEGKVASIAVMGWEVRPRFYKNLVYGTNKMAEQPCCHR